MAFDFRTLTFISGSQGKIRELKSLLGDFAVQEVDLVEIQAATEIEIIEHKLAAAHTLIKGSIFVEDTCLEFDALNRLPGPYIKWFIQALGVNGVADLVLSLESQAARAVSTIGFWPIDANQPEFFRGEVSGTIVASRGSGFGWDAIFLPEGHTQTFGEMTTEEKGQCSHRSRSAALFKSFLERMG